MGDQIDCDPEKPRQRALDARVVRRAALERQDERLGREVVGDDAADASAEVPAYTER